MTTMTRRWQFAWAWCLATVLLTGCVVPPRTAPPFEPPANPAPAPHAALGIVVKDQATGADIPGARVQLHTGESGTTGPSGYVVFQNLILGGRGISVQADGYVDGFLSVDEFTANRQVEVWIVKVAPPTPPAPQHPNPLIGRLRIEGDCFRDDTGCVLPLYAHAGDFFSIYTRDRVKVRDQLDRLAAAGYHGIRAWSTLGCGAGIADCPFGAFWRGREVGPQITPNYEGQLEAFLRELLERKLRIVLSQGDVGQLRDRRAYMEMVVRIEQRIAAPVVDWIDCGNEAWQTGEPDPVALARCVGYYKAAGGRALLTLTSPPEETKDDLDKYSIAPADAYDVHSYRGGHWYDKRRHIFSIPYEGKPAKRFGINSEPPGNGALVSASQGKAELDGEAVALMGVTAAYARQAWVWFSGEGVKLEHGLQGEAGFFETPRAFAWLPKDLMRFQLLHHGGDSWRSTRVLAAQGEVRVDGRIHDDGRFLYTIDGPSGRYQLQVDRSFAGQLCHTGPGACVDVARKAGERLEVEFTRGRVLKGRVQ